MLVNMRHTRRDVLRATGGLSVIGATGLAGCSGSDSTPDGGDGGSDGDGGDGGSDGDGGGGGGSSPESVTIGVVGPRSGPLSQLWPFYIENIRLAVDQINGDGNFVHDGGGLDVGGETLELEFQAYDTEAKPNVGVNAAERLIEQDGVPAILGAMSSTVTMAIMEVTEEAEIPQITSVSTSPEITQPPTWHEWMFRNKDTAAMRANWIVRGIAENIGAESVGMIGPNDDFGVDQMDTYEERLEEFDVEVTAKQVVNPEQQSFNTEFQQIHSDDPDLLYLAINDPAMGELMVPQARQVGFETIMAPAPLSSPDVPESMGDAINDVYVEVPFPADPEGISHVDQWTGALDSATDGEIQPNFIGAPTYDAVNLVADSIERAGSTDPSAIRDAMTETSMTGVYGYPEFTLEFDDQNQADVQSGIGQWQGGNLEILTGPFAED